MGEQFRQCSLTWQWMCLHVRNIVPLSQATDHDFNALFFQTIRNVSILRKFWFIPSWISGSKHRSKRKRTTGNLKQVNLRMADCMFSVNAGCDFLNTGIPYWFHSADLQWHWHYPPRSVSILSEGAWFVFLEMFFHLKMLPPPLILQMRRDILSLLHQTNPRHTGLTSVQMCQGWC